ncbi:MAG: biotin/lipoate A/B protein ligase family protein [Planctomycetota bacterium]|nr:biotin/lipoate A/B protein ligase family protein [Planctomycetota bacterium]
MPRTQTPVRLIDAGVVSAIRSQALYHGLAHARTADSPDTVVLATPGEPYVCIGYHQNLEHTIDRAFCSQRGLPVVRRETGGGAVYLDSDQLFVQWIMGPGRMPLRVDRRFALFCEVLAAAYRDHAVAASFQPVGDVHVDGRKISGTGAAQIGEAEVMTGNLLFDFDTSMMARIVRSPSTAFAEQVQRSLDAYMTSMRRELDRLPGREAVAASYANHAAVALNAELVPGELTEIELRSIERWEQQAADPVRDDPQQGLRRPGVKIHEGVYVVERQLASEGRELRVTARLAGDRIEEVAVFEVASRAAADESAGFAAGSAVASEATDSPSEPGFAALEAALRGLTIEPEPVREALEHYNSHNPQPLQVATWSQALLDLRRPQPSAARQQS